MNEEKSRLINSKLLNDRKKALSDFLSTEQWHLNRSLIERFMRDADKSIRAEMCYSICQQSPELFEIELRYISNGQDLDLKENALHALTKIKCLNNITLFIQNIPAASEELEEAIKSNLLEILQEDQDNVLKYVFESFSDSDESIRETALAIFAKSSDKPTSIKSFLVYLRSVSPSIRASVFEIAKKKLVLFATLCTQALKVETDPSLRIQAISVLKHFKDNALEDILIEEIKSEDWTLQRFAMLSLAEIKSEKGKEILIELLDQAEKMIDSVAALKKYEQPELGAHFVSKLAKASDKAQLVLLDAIKEAANNNIEYVKHLIAFAADEVSVEQAKLSALKIAEDICIQNKVEVPEQVSLIKQQINDVKRASIPDLGLKLATE